MFTQFRVRYPKGCLIGELLTIDHGKYVVRALVQVEGVTLATGMAAADNVELAEDRARSRALEVLGIVSTTATHSATAGGEVAERQSDRFGAATLTEPLSGTERRLFAPGTLDTPPVESEVSMASKTPSPNSQPTFSPESQRLSGQSPIFPDTFSINNDATDVSFSAIGRPDFSSSAAPIPWETSSIPFADDSSLGDPEMTGENNGFEGFNLEAPAPAPPKPAFGEQQKAEERWGFEGTPDIQINLPPITPPPLSNNQPLTNTDETLASGTPTDMSDVIAQTSVEIKRLGWSNQQGKNYLQQTYNKRSRTQLTDRELLEFLHYLKSQPSPDD